MPDTPTRLPALGIQVARTAKVGSRPNSRAPSFAATLGAAKPAAAASSKSPTLNSPLTWSRMKPEFPERNCAPTMFEPWVLSGACRSQSCPALRVNQGAATQSMRAMRRRGSEATVGEALAKSRKSSSNCPRTAPFSLNWKPSRDCPTWKVNRSAVGAAASTGFAAAVGAVPLGCENDSTASAAKTTVGLKVP